MHVLLQYSETSYYVHIQYKMASIKFLFLFLRREGGGEVLQKSLKVWVKCDYREDLHVEMHVHTLDLNIAHNRSFQKNCAKSGEV